MGLCVCVGGGGWGRLVGVGWAEEGREVFDGVHPQKSKSLLERQKGFNTV